MEISDQGQVGLGSFPAVDPFQVLVTFAEKLLKVNDMEDGVSKGAPKPIVSEAMLGMLDTTLAISFADLDHPNQNVQVERAAQTLTYLLQGTRYVPFLDSLLTVLRCTVSIRVAQHEIEMCTGSIRGAQHEINVMAGVHPTM